MTHPRLVPPLPTSPLPTPATPPGDPIVAAVAALPGLPPQAATDRYGVRRLTVIWLLGFAPHTRTAYFRDLSRFLTWCQQQQLDPLTARTGDLDLYRVELAAAGAAPATVHRRLAALSSWYRHLVANGAATTNPVTGVRRPPVDRDASTTTGLTSAEVRALLRCADAQVRDRAAGAHGSPGQRARYLAALRDRALVRLLADLGLRVGEALALDVNALSHNQGRPTLRYVAKGNRLRERPLTPAAQAAVEEYLAARAQAAGVPRPRLTGPLLATSGRDGRQVAVGGRMDEPAAFRLIRRLARQAGLPTADRLSPHSLRHAFATNARELGVPLEDVQDAMGHADARTTRRYDRARHALHRDPALRLSELYRDDTPPTAPSGGSHPWGGGSPPPPRGS